ncbi:hypothetical protein GCM10009117_26970 [Gangjinia marincola]|uniref:Tetratricopeptide repeat protein n=1 Tax=Gangjinia marincola TaxID=578463 RepID=A0ABP3XW57_9FLAO
MEFIFQAYRRLHHPKKIFFLSCFFFLSFALLFSQTNIEQAEELYHQKEYLKAKPLLKSYLKANPTDERTQMYLGDIAMFQKDFERALEYYTLLVERFPNNADYQFRYGGALAYHVQEMPKVKAVFYVDDIEESFLKAAKLDPSHIEARWALIEFYIQLPYLLGGGEEKALIYAKELAELSKVDGHLAKGYIADQNDRKKDAEYHYKKAVEIGGSMHTYDKLSTHYEKSGNAQKSLETKLSAKTKHKRNQLNYQIGRIVAEYNLDAETGITALNEFIERHSFQDSVGKEWAYLRLAQIYRKNGAKSQAELWVKKALTEREDFKEAKIERENISKL